jgi:hypothetical protein
MGQVGVRSHIEEPEAQSNVPVPQHRSTWPQKNVPAGARTL